MQKYEIVIGLETHVQLKTKSKMFCSCDNTGENQPPNTTICPICSGHPGVLPVANGQAITWAVMAALALQCKINKQSHFDRKNYFYPDLPKGYQISQYAAPFGHDGHVVISVAGQRHRVRIERVHLEEDTGKLLHEPDHSASYIDYNRAGTPLLEIVTKPDIKSPQVAKQFLQDLRLIMRYLGISDAEMEKGHLRCDANISLRYNPELLADKPEEVGKLHPKTEVKNLNSFRAVERALEYEIKRQTELWDQGKPPAIQSTRGWDDKKGITIEQRTKEEQHDYRYFPEPDIPPLELSDTFISAIQKETIELPEHKKERFKTAYELNEYDASLLITDKTLANFFENVISELKAWLITLEGIEGTEEEIWKNHKKKLVKIIANWIISRLLSLVNKANINIKDLKITPENFAELITLIYQHKLNNQTALLVLEKMFATGGDPSDIMQEENLVQLKGEDDIQRVIEEVLQANGKIVEQYKAGKSAALQFLIGQVMKKTKGRADVHKVSEMILFKIK
jgi:aspartyl-tRNA(Asn)/glutamyl-tRNA(Gln) amidotransferase subunit B